MEARNRVCGIIEVAFRLFLLFEQVPASEQQAFARQHFARVSAGFTLTGFPPSHSHYCAGFIGWRVLKEPSPLWNNTIKV